MKAGLSAGIYEALLIFFDINPRTRTANFTETASFSVVTLARGAGVLRRRGFAYSLRAQVQVE